GPTARATPGLPPPTRFTSTAMPWHTPPSPAAMAKSSSGGDPNGTQRMEAERLQPLLRQLRHRGPDRGAADHPGDPPPLGQDLDAAVDVTEAAGVLLPFVECHWDHHRKRTLPSRPDSAACARASRYW